jgi:hypothetical protein
MIALLGRLGALEMQKKHLQELTIVLVFLNVKCAFTKRFAMKKSEFKK